MNPVNDACDDLANIRKDLKSEKLTVPVAKELINAHGKEINYRKAQLEYYALRNENPQIDFLKDDSKAK